MKGRVARAKVASKGGEGGEGRAVRVRAVRVRVRGMEWRTYLDRRYTKVIGKVKTSVVESAVRGRVASAKAASDGGEGRVGQRGQGGVGQ